MIEKIIKYEVKVSVPSSQASQHLKKFENVIYKAINQGQGMKQTDVVSIKVVGNENSLRDEVWNVQTPK